MRATTLLVAACLVVGAVALAGCTGDESTYNADEGGRKQLDTEMEVQPAPANESDETSGAEGDAAP